MAACVQVPPRRAPLTRRAAARCAGRPRKRPAPIAVRHSGAYMVARRRGELDDEGALEGGASGGDLVGAAPTQAPRRPARGASGEQGAPLPASQLAVRKLDETLDGVESRGASRAEVVAAEAAFAAGENLRDFVSDPEVQEAAKQVASLTGKAAAWGVKTGGKLAFQAAAALAKAQSGSQGNKK